MAGIYHPGEVTPFRCNSEGQADELTFGPQFDGDFPLRFTSISNLADPRTDRPNPDRKLLLDRMDVIKKRSNLTLVNEVSLAVDLIRLNQPEQAISRLNALSRQRIPDFRVLTAIAHAHATRAELDDAIRWHEVAILDAGMPDDLAGTTPEQRRWLKRVETEYYRRWLQIHRDRSRQKQTTENEGVFPLFDVLWQNDAGEYMPSFMSAREAKKLPADAAAIVQQLLLWAPWDTSLYWLLAEIYSATGRLRQADQIFSRIADGRQYSNRTQFMTHRAIVRGIVEKLPVLAPDLPDLSGLQSPTAEEAKMGSFLPSEGKALLVAAGFGIVAIILIALQIRSITRRWQQSSIEK